MIDYSELCLGLRNGRTGLMPKAADAIEELQARFAAAETEAQMLSDLQEITFSAVKGLKSHLNALMKAAQPFLEADGVTYIQASAQAYANLRAVIDEIKGARNDRP